jgi:triphosphoribosyl-dephospho-CoA synthetase
MTAEQEQFINHLQQLLSLTDVQRCRREDWQTLKKMLSDKGYWRRRKPPVSKKRQKQAEIMLKAKSDKRLAEQQQLIETNRILRDRVQFLNQKISRQDDDME